MTNEQHHAGTNQYRQLLKTEPAATESSPGFRASVEGLAVRGCYMKAEQQSSELKCGLHSPAGLGWVLYFHQGFLLANMTQEHNLSLLEMKNRNES